MMPRLIFKLGSWAVSTKFKSPTGWCVMVCRQSLIHTMPCFITCSVKHKIYKLYNKSPPNYATAGNYFLYKLVPVSHTTIWSPAQVETFDIAPNHLWNKIVKRKMPWHSFLRLQASFVYFFYLTYLLLIYCAIEIGR